MFLFTNSARTLLAVAAALLWLSSALQPLPARDVGEECESLGLFPDWLLCTNKCTEGCASVSVNTNGGNEGEMCSCDIIGPPAVCCKIAIVLATMDFEVVGQCALVGCNQGTCERIGIVQPPHWEQIGWAARCL